MKLICFDTGPLIFGVQRTAKPEQLHMIPQMERYLRYLAGQKDVRIIVPSPVVHEYLAGFPLEEQDAQLQALESRFLMPSFDVPAVRIAAGIADATRTYRAPPGGDISRQAQKMDVQVIAIAVAQKAKLIVTHNVKHFRTLARGLIEVTDIPDIREQKSLDFPA